ncbi:uncharacterized protein LOC135166930 isoform X2 [Diachasmimorpha longicaudata]|uniref:uncharacterized protein LOC135166930 isoform X2 n=1 Tax=Diachasmimorpha longicaudata TaxID=58733 RepID=UPI0030B8E6A2
MTVFLNVFPCKLIIDSIYSFSDDISSEQETNTREWATNLKKDLINPQFEAYVYADDIAQGNLCDYEDDDINGMAALLLTMIFEEAMCELGEGEWKAVSQREIPEKICETFLNQTQDEQILLKYDINLDNENIAAANLVVRSAQWTPYRRG